MDNPEQTTGNTISKVQSTDIGRVLLSNWPSIDSSVVDAVKLASKMAINAAVEGLDKIMTSELENINGKRAYTVVINHGNGPGNGEQISTVFTTTPSGETENLITENGKAISSATNQSSPAIDRMALQKILEDMKPDGAPYTPVSFEEIQEPGPDSAKKSVSIFQDTFGNQHRVQTSVNTNMQLTENKIGRTEFIIPNSASLAVEAKTPDMATAVQVGVTKIFYYPNRELGFGATSVVYEGYHMCQHRPAAVKKFREDCNDVYEKELKVWLALTKEQTLENMNIVRLFEYTPLRDETRKLTNYFLAMEMAKTDLTTRLEQLQTEPGNHYDKLVGYLRDVGNALRFLHGQRHKIIHRDVKPRNILLFGYNPDGNGNGIEIAKLADFGVSRVLSYTISATNSVAAGTMNFMSPEALNALLDDEQFVNTCGMDIFSFGMTCHYTMSLGNQHPFNTGKGSISKNIRTPSVKPLRLSSENGVPNHFCANHLFGWMMSKAMDEQERPLRPDIEQVMHHPFFWSPMKTLEFVVAVGSSFSHAHDNDDEKHVRKKMDENFLRFYCYPESSVQQHNENFDWTAILGESFYEMCRRRKSGASGEITKPYEGASISSFVELIVDMITNYRDLLDELVQSGDPLGMQLTAAGDGMHSQQKFGLYLINKIPGALICLYSTLKEMGNTGVAPIRERFCLK